MRCSIIILDFMVSAKLVSSTRRVFTLVGVARRLGRAAPIWADGLAPWMGQACLINESQRRKDRQGKYLAMNS